MMVFLRRKSRVSPKPEPDSTSGTEDLRQNCKSCGSSSLMGPSALENASAIEGSVTDLDQFLAIPKPDNELVDELQSLGHLIQQHVEDHYHLLDVDQNISSLSHALEEIGLSDDMKGVPGPEQLAALAVDAETRHVALQHIVARALFDSISPKLAGKISLLPLPVSLLMRVMPPAEKHTGNEEGKLPHSRSHAFCNSD